MTRSTIQILQLTDTHIDTPATRESGRPDPMPSFLRVRDAALARVDEIDLVLLTGDLASHGEQEAYAWLVEQLAPLHKPVYCLPGNHDDVTVMKPLVEAAGWYYGGAYLLGGWLLVLLDSCIANAPGGRLDSTALDALRDHLTSHAAASTLIALHHHPLPIGSAWIDAMGLENHAALWSTIEAHPNVRGVVYGHVHQNRDTYRERVRVLASPSTCAQFAPRSPGFALDRRPPAYRWIELSEKGDISTHVVRV